MKLFSLHGMMGDGEDLKFLNQLEVVEHIALELPGHGKNLHSIDKLTSWQQCTELYAREIQDRCQGQDYVLYGYSMGGRLMGSVARLLLKSESIPRALILESSHPGDLNENERLERASRDRELFHFTPNLGACREFLANWWSAPLFGKMNQQDIFQELLERKAREALTLMPFWQKSLNLLSVAHQPSDKEFFLSQKELPLLYLAGTQDQKYSLIAKDLAVNDQTTVKYIKAGHNIHFMCPHELLCELKSFLLAL